MTLGLATRLLTIAIGIKTTAIGIAWYLNPAVNRRRARGALVRLTRTCLLGLGLARSLGAGLARRPSLQLSLRLGWRHSLRLGVGPEEHDE